MDLLLSVVIHLYNFDPLELFQGETTECGGGKMLIIIIKLLCNKLTVALYKIVPVQNCGIPFTTLTFTTQMFVSFFLSNYFESRCIIGVK